MAGGLTAPCLVLVRRHALGRPIPTSVITRGEAEAADAKPNPADRLRWVALAFVPSSLLLGVTTYLTTNVAAVPFLWVMPLALYLLTFVIVFGPSGPHGAAPPGRAACSAGEDLHARRVLTLCPSPMKER
ncbi:MAG: hypothetical protein ABIQ49_11785 [Gemmatimonadales bacterium]